jgi:glyoxylase-like metal-dependent hydrolase (beta-lactamase superfamily II)
LIVETFLAGPLACNCTILCDDKTKEAIVVDGGDGIPEVMKRLERLGARAKYLVHTHAHIDHIGDLGTLRERTGAQGLLHPADLPLYHSLRMQARWLEMYEVPRIVDLDGDLRDGDRIRAGGVEIDVLHTPGHTPGSVCFAFADGGSHTILSGDTLFAGAIGRWDLGGTSMEDIVDSIQRKLLPFDDETRVIPGHGPFTTIGEERNTNPYLQ